ncbi:MAG: hypothetical protein WBE13_03230 [Candidatus Acidiferrum sp.]
MNQILGVTLKFFRSGRFSAVALLVGLGLLLTPTGARAGCGFPSKAGPTPRIPFLTLSPQNQDGDEPREPATIVGLWHVDYTATFSTPGPPLPVPSPAPSGGFQFIQSYKTWHADGTEFENAFLPPTGGNVCYGVWKDLGHGMVKLHHIGLMFTPDGTALANIFTVDETDTVSADGRTYTGHFDFKIYDPTDVFGTGTVVQELKGTTAATRITVD